jgi:hypothetical protein
MARLACRLRELTRVEHFSRHYFGPLSRRRPGGDSAAVNRPGRRISRTLRL